MHASDIRESPTRGEPPSLDIEPPTILLAEDDVELRSLLASTLRRMGYAVLEARSGGQLLSLIQSFFHSGQNLRAPELILSDVRMPGASGLQVLEWLRGSDRATPVILITAFGDEELHRRATALGATHVIDKPFELSMLKKRVAEAVPLP